MNQTNIVTTKLVVDSSGAIAGLAKTEKAFDNTGSAAAQFTGQVDRMRAAQQAGLPVLEARAAALSREQAIYQKLVASANPILAKQLQAERDLSRAAAAGANLVIQGRLGEAEALRGLQQLEAARTKAIAAAVGDTGRLAAANDNLAASYQRIGQTSNFATANIAAQLQDIAVTSQMGMSPLQIALQQGTQLSAALGGQGLRGTVMALGGAFASLVSPVSLATIGVIALGSAGIQSLMAMMSGAQDATEALEEHADWLQTVLEGYEAAQQAAAGFVEAASTRPVGAVQSDLETARIAALQEVDRILASIEAREAEIATDLQQMNLSKALHADTIEAATALQDLGTSATSTREEISAVVVQLTRLANDSGASDQARQYARDLLGTVNQLIAARTEADSLAVSLNTLPTEIPIIVRMHGLEGVAAAVEQLHRMTPDLRTERQQADDIFSNNVSQARTISEIDALVAAHGKFTAALSEQERQAEALKTAHKGVAAAQQAQDNSAYLADLQAEVTALQMTGQARTDALELLEQERAIRAAIAQLGPSASQSDIALVRQLVPLQQQLRDDLKGVGMDANEAANQLSQTLGAALSSLFDGPMDDADEFFNKLISGFAQMGQANLGKMFEGFGGQGQGSNADGPTNIFDALFQATKEGTQQGSATGVFAGLKGAQGMSSMASAGLGGFGLGYQAQDPLMGGLGGAAAGAMAGMAGGPAGMALGAPIGKISGLTAKREAA
jgi:hypothetical protein